MHPLRPHQRPPALGRQLAEQLIEGEVAVEALPATWARIAVLVSQAAGPSQAHELDGERSILTAVSGELVSFAPMRLRLEGTLIALGARARGGRRRGLKGRGSLGMALAGLTGGRRRADGASVPRPLGQIPEEEFQGHLAGACRGDEASFAALWRVFNPGLVRFLSGSADREDVQDLASTVWLEAVRGLDRFQGDASGFRAWLFTMARHRVVDLRRAEGRRPRLVHQVEHDEPHDAGDLDPATELEEDWSTEDAIAVIGSLPPDQAEVLLLRIVADLDVATVAGIVGKQPGTVRVLSHRGLRRLAQLLETDPDRQRDVTR